MKGIYLYPITKRNKTGVSNPYVMRLAESLSGKYHVLNKVHPSDKGIIDILKYLKNTNIVYLNWIENLPGRHLGFLQFCLFFLLCGYFRLTRKKIVWTLHNKSSHSAEHRILKNLLYRFMLFRSDLIITHAEEGLKLIPKKTEKLFIPHPVSFSEPLVNDEKDRNYDILIWGTITRYKGIDTFLHYLKDEGVLNNYKIVVAGKTVDGEVLERINNLVEKYPNLVYMNRYIPDDELAGIIADTGVILFTYHADSVLSSGALMDSLQYDINILGPETGAFNDLAKEGLIKTYRDYPDLLEKIKLLKVKSYQEPFRKELKRKFIKDNSWASFAKKVSVALEGLEH